MALSLENFLNNFLKTFPEPFSAREMLYMVNALGTKCTLEELTDFLDNDARVFALQKKLYITRSGAFTGKIFSVLLTPREIENKVMIPGDRFMPFVDGEVLSFYLKFSFLEKKLRTKKIEMDKCAALDLFRLFGDEYCVQYIASDPALKNVKIAENDFELPQKLTLTGINLEPVLEGIDFKPGDRLICRVTDWARGEIEIYPVLERKENPFEITEGDFERQQWNETLEKALLESFEKMGPCSCMEEQLANVFYEYSKELCVTGCGSVHEFLSWTKKIGIQYFGVETRLWYNNQDVPAVGKWNMTVYNGVSDGSLPFFSRPDFVIDSFIKDFLYEKKSEKEFPELIKKILPSDVGLSEKERKEFTDQIHERNKALRQSYNWFADYTYGSIRHRALKLYSRVEEFVNDIDCNDNEYIELPQQELVTLSQLFTHITRILEITSSEIECGDDETYAMQLSIEGMELNFDEITSMIKSALIKLRKRKFDVI